MKVKLLIFLLVSLFFSSILLFNKTHLYKEKTIDYGDSQEGGPLVPNIVIKDGNIVKIGDNGEVTILIDKKNYPDVQAFTEVNVSPDGEKICFLGQYIVPIWLYYANVDGSNIKRLDIAKNCVWSHDSKKIAYNNHTTDVSPVSIYIYDIEKGTKVDATKKPQKTDFVRVFGKPSWSDDDKFIYSDLIEFEDSDVMNQRKLKAKVDLEKSWVYEVD